MRTGWRKWVWNMLVAADQFGNTLVGGDPDETISSRAGKGYTQGKRWARGLCWLLDKIDPGHCAASVENDEGANQVWGDK